jgi:hypothetical protein
MEAENDSALPDEAPNTLAGTRGTGSMIWLPASSTYSTYVLNEMDTPETGAALNDTDTAPAADEPA